MKINLDNFTVDNSITRNIIIFNGIESESTAYQFSHFNKWFAKAIGDSSKKQLGRTFLLYQFYMDNDGIYSGFKSINGYYSATAPFTSAIYSVYFNAFFSINSTTIRINRVRMNYDSRSVEETKIKNKKAHVELDHIEKKFKQYNNKCKKFIRKYEKSKKHNS